MGLNSDVKTGINDVLAPAWVEVNGQKVPETEDIALSNGAVNLQATYLYADMADSTGLAQQYKKFAVAKVIRCYLNAATRIIKYHDGEIRSFDGDRVMGIFIGGSKNTNAVKAALNISWAVEKVINPKLKAKWDSFDWKMDHGVGIDTGDAMLVRGGVRGTNDIVSIGGAPNVAAKLSEIRSSKTIYISEDVYDHTSDEVKYADTTNIWTRMGVEKFGGTSVTYFGTLYHLEP
jgi:class 3 adenylate cyclase